MAKRSTIRITKRVVDDLGPADEVWDSQLKGFGVRCQAKGKSYILKTTVQRRQRWITIGRHGSKTGAKSVSLSEPAIELLQKLPRIHGNPFVIVGRRRGCHLVDLQRPWQRIRKAAGLSDVRIHDLRHSYASLAIQNGISLSVIGKLLGHRSSETTRRYAHFEDAYVTSESDKIGQLLTAVMSAAKAP